MLPGWQRLSTRCMPNRDQTCCLNTEPPIHSFASGESLMPVSHIYTYGVTGTTTPAAAQPWTRSSRSEQDRRRRDIEPTKWEHFSYREHVSRQAPLARQNFRHKVIPVPSSARMKGGLPKSKIARVVSTTSHQKQKAGFQINASSIARVQCHLNLWFIFNNSIRFFCLP